jgi:hypothetical protein
MKLNGLDFIFTQAQHRAEVSFTFFIKNAFILYISAYNTASPLLMYTIFLYTDLYFKRNKSF